MKAAEAAPALSEAQVARAQLEMSRLMQAGESVAAALKRMRGGGDTGPKKGERTGQRGAGALSIAAQRYLPAVEAPLMREPAFQEYRVSTPCS
jgi:hypothetical protein